MENILFNGKLSGFRIEHIRREKHYSMPINHFHEYYEIYYLLSGKRHYFIESRNYYIKKGDLVIVDSNQIHKTNDIDDMEHERILLELEPSLLTSLNSFIADGFIEKSVFANYGVISLEAEGQQIVEEILSCIMTEITEQNTGYNGMVMAKLIEFFTFIARTLKSKPSSKLYDNSHKQNSKIDEIADYISSNYAENIDLDSLSDAFFISKYHLCRSFKKFTGFTINEYITINRVMQAKKLLTETNLSITKVAEKVGYQCLTNFGRAFKQILGKNPTEFRKTYKT
ncbi:MAG: AraC family transcriptional regulator [Clostridiaceae bacterium]|jgi:YesN/AraC family two-component response regulator|nr:AraC family transcriptional regulator [Clostridiaceae bacterium]